MLVPVDVAPTWLHAFLANSSKCFRSSSIFMTSMLCLETSRSEGSWPNDSLGVGWATKSSRTMVVVSEPTSVTSNKRVTLRVSCYVTLLCANSKTLQVTRATSSASFQCLILKCQIPKTEPYAFKL